MKYLYKLPLLTLSLSLCASGADSSGEKPRTIEAAKPAFSITAFSLKSSDGKLKMSMDDQGQITVNGRHVVSANAKGEFNTPNGKLLMQVKENGEVAPDLMGAPVKVTRDGTLTGGGQNLSWVDGKFRIGNHGHLEITPKDSPSKQAATLMFLIASIVRVEEQPK